MAELADRPGAVGSRLRLAGWCFLLIVMAVSGCTASGSHPAGSGPASSPSAAKSTSSPASSPAVRPSSVPARPLAACRPGDLRVSAAGGGAAAGSVGLRIAFTNTGAPCRVTGWPSVRAITAAGTSTTLTQRLNTMLGPSALTAPPAITLPHGGQAIAVIGAGDNPVGNATSCPPPFRTLAVTPPGGTTETVISAWVPGLDAYLPACYPPVITPLVRPGDL